MGWKGEQEEAMIVHPRNVTSVRRWPVVTPTRLATKSTQCDRHAIATRYTGGCVCVPRTLCIAHKGRCCIYVGEERRLQGDHAVHSVQTSHHSITFFVCSSMLLMIRKVAHLHCE